VDLPDPPFSLATTMTRTLGAEFTCINALPLFGRLSFVDGQSELIRSKSRQVFRSIF